MQQQYYPAPATTFYPPHSTPSSPLSPQPFHQEEFQINVQYGGQTINRLDQVERDRKMNPKIWCAHVHHQPEQCPLKDSRILVSSDLICPDKLDWTTKAKAVYFGHVTKMPPSGPQFKLEIQVVNEANKKLEQCRDCRKPQESPNGVNNQNPLPPCSSFVQVRCPYVDTKKGSFRLPIKFVCVPSHQVGGMSRQLHVEFKLTQTDPSGAWLPSAAVAIARIPLHFRTHAATERPHSDRSERSQGGSQIGERDKMALLVNSHKSTNHTTNKKPRIEHGQPVAYAYEPHAHNEVMTSPDTDEVYYESSPAANYMTEEIPGQFPNQGLTLAESLELLAIREKLCTELCRQLNESKQTIQALRAELQAKDKEFLELRRLKTENEKLQVEKDHLLSENALLKEENKTIKQEIVDKEKEVQTQQLAWNELEQRLKNIRINHEPSSPGPGNVKQLKLFYETEDGTRKRAVNPNLPLKSPRQYGSPQPQTLQTHQIQIQPQTAQSLQVPLPFSPTGQVYPTYSYPGQEFNCNVHVHMH